MGNKHSANISGSNSRAKGQLRRQGENVVQAVRRVSEDEDAKAAPEDVKRLSSPPSPSPRRMQESEGVTVTMSGDFFLSFFLSSLTT